MNLPPVVTNGAIILGVQVLPVAVGYRLKVRGILKEAWGRPLSRFIIVVIETIVSLLAAWNLDIDWAVMSRMFAIALLFGMLMTGVGWVFSRFHSKARADQGGYILATAISNFGYTMAGFVCMMLIDRNALSIQSIYIAPLTLLIFLVWFPMARSFGTSGSPGLKPLMKESLRGLVDLTSLPMHSMLVGLALHACQVPFLRFLGPTLDGFVYTDVILSMLCIGLTLQLDSLFQFRAQTLSIAAAKFLIAPALGLLLAILFGIHGVHLQVVVVCSSVPVGLYSSFAASLFGLNRNLTNALLILTTAFYLVVVLPLLFWLLPLLA